MHHRHPAYLSEPMSQLLRVPGVLHQQIDAGFADGGKDRRFLGLKVQLALAPRRGCHERQPQPELIQPGPILSRWSQAPHHRKTGQLVFGQQPTARRGQQLKRGPQHRPRPLRR